MACAAVVEAQQFQSLEGAVRQPPSAKAVEDPQSIGLTARGTVVAPSKVVTEAVETEIFSHGHAVAYGVHSVTAEVGTVVKGGTDDEVLTCLNVEEACIKLGEDVLDSKGEISGAARQVDPVLGRGVQAGLETTTDALVDVAVLVAFEGDEVNLVVGQTEQGGIRGEKLAVLTGGNKQETVLFLVVLLEEQVGGQRLFGVEYVDKCFHFSISIHP